MTVFTQWRFWRFKLPPGQLVGEAMVAYGAARVAGECFRAPDASDWLPDRLTDILSPGQFYSILLAAAGAAVIVFARRRAARQAAAAGNGDGNDAPAAPKSAVPPES